MRTFSTLALSLTLGLLSVTASSAQFADPRVALAGRDGAMTCGVYSHLSPGHRAAIVRGLNGSAPPRSLSPTTSTQGFSGHPGSRQKVVENSSTDLGSMLTAGALVAACQTAAPGESLRSAYESYDTKFNVTGHRHR